MRARNIAKKIQTMVAQSKDGVKFPAFLGNAAGVVKADNYNNVYVIIAGSVFVAHNEVVPNISRLPVLVAKRSGKLEVVSARNAFHETPHINIPDHDHTWGKSNNPTWVRGEQFLPALITPNDGLSLHFKGWIYWIDDAFVPAYEQDIDFSSNLPSAGALIGLLEIDATGAISILEGTPVDSRDLLTYADIPPPSIGKTPLGFAVKLYAGQTKALQGLDFSSSDLIDLRWTGYSNGGSGSFITDWGNIQNLPTWINAIESGQLLEFIEIDRWSALAGDHTFDFSDFVLEIISIEVNGVVQDPLTYTLSSDNLQVVLDTPLAFDAIVTSKYKIEVL
jgi:hypothetical protein